METISFETVMAELARMIHDMADELMEEDIKRQDAIKRNEDQQ